MRNGGATTTLYLRGVPVELVREAKAEAARSGKTLATLVAESLEQRLKGPRAHRASASKLHEDVAWYERNRDQLLEKYRGHTVAIVDRAVIDHDRDFERLARRVFARFGARSIFMPRLTGEGERVRVRSPRVRARTRSEKLRVGRPSA